MTKIFQSVTQRISDYNFLQTIGPILIFLKNRGSVCEFLQTRRYQNAIIPFKIYYHCSILEQKNNNNVATLTSVVIIKIHIFFHFIQFLKNGNLGMPTNYAKHSTIFYNDQISFYHESNNYWLK